MTAQNKGAANNEPMVPANNEHQPNRAGQGLLMRRRGNGPTRSEYV